MTKILGTKLGRVGLVVGFALLATACLPTFGGNFHLVAKSGTGSSARLIWNQAFDEDAGDSIAYYELSVDGTVVDTVVAPATNCTMTGLASGTTYAFSVTAYSNHGGGTEWSGNIGGTYAVLGRLSTTFTTPAGAIAGGTKSCTNGDTDTDGDRLPDWAETNTGTFVNEGNTGTNPNVADTDGDGIKDGDETLGTLSGLNLPQMGFMPTHKDLAMEFDWFDDNAEPGTCPAHSHRPTPAIVSAVSAAYANSPMSNPDGTTGVHLVADYGQGAPFTGGNLISDADGQINVTFDVSGLGFGGSEFLNLKAANFAPNRNGYFHYVLMPHRYNGSDSSGVAELPGDDTIVSLYCYGSTTNVANTIVHEMGHNLNLHHGGTVDTNYKPNYNSVMNYQFQFPGIDTNCDALGDGVLDYSRGTRISLNETSLNEAAGVCGASAIDWNNNGVVNSGVSLDINGDGLKTVLTDNNDWATVSFAGLSDADGARVNPPEVIVEQTVPTSAR
ncbi:MAG: fibronectin type III domain-containing protein [Acidimicrobiales bacterium]